MTRQAVRRAGPTATELPVLDLSGPPITAALEALITGSEADGGIERYVAALRLKVSLFRDNFAGGAHALEHSSFKTLCALMASVRRRIGAHLADGGFAAIREALVELLDGAADTATADARLAMFCARFPQDRAHRWVRDLAAEVLHYTHPELYPLMCRWVWDAKANTGVLREIWHGEDVDRRIIDVPDSYATFLSLRQELAQFLSENGVFRDVPLFIDLLLAQIYAGYIGSQGGAFLRADFTSEEDPMQYVRRMLGLDGAGARGTRTRLKVVDGEASAVADAKLLN